MEHVPGRLNRALALSLKPVDPLTRLGFSDRDPFTTRPDAAADPSPTSAAAPARRRAARPPTCDRCGGGRCHLTRCCCGSAGGAHGDGPPACDSCCGGRRRPTRCCGGSTCRAGAAGPPRRLRPAGRCAGAAGHGHHHSTSQPGPARAPLFVHLLRRHVEPGALHRPLLWPHLQGRGSHRGLRSRLPWSLAGAGHATPGRRRLHHWLLLALPPRQGEADRLCVPDEGG